MKLKDRIPNLCLINILIVSSVMIVLVVVVTYRLKTYTHYDEQVRVPNITGLQLKQADMLLNRRFLSSRIADSTYNKNKTLESILTIEPSNGVLVKKGRVISLILNVSKIPLQTVPKIMNLSVKYALHLLSSHKFDDINVRIVPSVYKHLVERTSGQTIITGNRIPLNTSLVLLISACEIDVSYSSDSVAILNENLGIYEF